MRALRTPDDRFENLPGWTFAPRYTEVPDGDGGRCASTTSTRARGHEAILVCTASRRGRTLPEDDPGHRRGLPAVAPDLVGFGRSDKPTDSTTTPTNGTSTG